MFEHPEDALILVDKTLKTVDLFAQMIQEGNKSLMSGSSSKAGQLTVYHNSFGRFGSNILTSSDLGSKVYYSYDLPNYLICEDQQFTAYTERWIEKVKNKSLPLSASSDLERFKFFNKITESIKSERAKLEQAIPKWQSNQK